MPSFLSISGMGKRELLTPWKSIGLASEKKSFSNDNINMMKYIIILLSEIAHREQGSSTSQNVLCLFCAPPILQPLSMRESRQIRSDQPIKLTFLKWELLEKLTAVVLCCPELLKQIPPSFYCSGNTDISSSPPLQEKMKHLYCQMERKPFPKKWNSFQRPTQWVCINESTSGPSSVQVSFPSATLP